jgi:hypothetical protein
VAATPNSSPRGTVRTTDPVHVTDTPGPVLSRGKVSATWSPGLNARAVSKKTLFALRSMARPVPSLTAIVASIR